MRALKIGLALVLAACGGEVPTALDRAATPIPPDVEDVTHPWQGWMDPTAPVPVPAPPAMYDPLEPMKPALPALGDPLRPILPTPPAMDDPVVPKIPLPGVDRLLQPAIPVPGGEPIWWRPKAVALEPMLMPKVWVSAVTARAGDEVRVSVANLVRHQRVVLAQATGVPEAYRFCGSGFADENGMVTGACRLAPNAGDTAMIFAYGNELDGEPLAAARVRVQNATPEIDIGVPIVAEARFVPLAGAATAHRDVALRVHDPYGDTFLATTVTADRDGRWTYVLGLPLNATLGRWTVFAQRKTAEGWLNAWFDVAPIAGVEVTPDLLGAYVLGLKPYDLVKFRFYDPQGWEIADLDAVANRHGWLVHNGEAPACAREGTWFVRMHYHDTRGDATWMDVTYPLHAGWCLF